MTRLLLVAATRAEIQPTIDFLLEHWDNEGQTATTAPPQSTKQAIPAHYQYGSIQLDLLLSGVGLPATAFALGHVLALHRYDLAIQAGIAGAIDPDLALGQVVQVGSERFADLGAETAQGAFMDLKSMGFLPTGPDGPFETDGRILPAAQSAVLLPDLAVCPALSVNKVHGQASSIAAIREHYPLAELESMEGAAFFYACRMREQACLQLRSISNYVAPRDKASWEIGLAVKRLNEVVEQVLLGYMAAGAAST